MNDVDALKMGEDTKEITRFVCFTALASKAKDAGLCERIDSETNKYLCIKEVAGATKDSAICNRIKPIRISGVEVKIDYLTHWCVAMAKRDLEECKKNRGFRVCVQVKVHRRSEGADGSELEISDSPR